MASKSCSSALLLAMLLLFAAASALAQAPEPAEEDYQPECPAPAVLDPLIVDALKGRTLPSRESIQETFGQLFTSEIVDCVCDRIVPVTGIENPTARDINFLADLVLKELLGGRFGNGDVVCSST